MLHADEKIAEFGTRQASDNLEKLGMSRLESRIYLELLVRGPRKASDLASAITINRIDVYRALKNLRRRGILEVAFTRPLRFSAVEPGTLQKILITEQELSLRTFRVETNKICEELDSLPRSSAFSQLDPKKDSSQSLRMGTQFQLKQGRQVYEKWKKMIEDSKGEMMIILSRVGLMTHSVEGFSDLYSKAVRRGVTIKMITEVDKENYEQAVEFSKVCTLNTTSSVGDMLRYVIVDYKEAMISGGYPSNDPREFTALLVSNSLLVKSLRLDFKEKWKKSKSFP
jgi:sugar-specific transcriptional regulator TrmB